MKELKIDGEITGFNYNKSFKEWEATFTISELKSFVKRIRKRAKAEVRNENHKK